MIQIDALNELYIIVWPLAILNGDHRRCRSLKKTRKNARRLDGRRRLLSVGRKLDWHWRLVAIGERIAAFIAEYALLKFSVRARACSPTYTPRAVEVFVFSIVADVDDAIEIANCEKTSAAPPSFAATSG